MPFSTNLFTKRYVLLILSFIFVTTNNSISAMNIGSFHSNGILNKTSQEIFSAMGKSFTTLKEANDFCQDNLLRKGERWDEQKETPVLKKCKENEETILKHLKKIGMIEAVYPTQKNFKYALCMGALKASVKQRLDFIANLQRNGYSINTIVLLGGDRPLRDEEKIDLPKNIKTEADMMKYLYDNHTEIKKTKMILISAPIVELPDGTTRRPNTDDTLEEFAKEFPEGGSCLVISNNPYLFRQSKVTQRILDQEKFPTYGAGDELNSEKTDVFILMDELARAIYEEYKK